MTTPPRKPVKDDAELIQVANLKPADHEYSTATSNSDSLRALERKMLGPSWGKKRAEFTGPR